MSGGESPTEREALCDTEHPVTGWLCSLPEGHERGHICERETPADEWEYGRAGRFVNDGTDARDDWWYGSRAAAEANISLLNEQEALEPFDLRVEYRLVRRRKAGPRDEVIPDDRA